MAIEVVDISETAYGKVAVVSVKFIDGVGRWKVQLGSHHAGLFCFTDRVLLTDARVIVDESLVRQKINMPESGHMFAFMAGVVRPYEAPGGCARRVNIFTRTPKVVEDAFFVYVDTREAVERFDRFYGDENGKAWVV